MAITRTTSWSLPAAQVPAGATPPAFTAISNPDISQVKTFDAAISGANANHVTALSNIVTDVDTQLGTYADTDLHLDALDTVTLNGLITNIERVNNTDYHLASGTLEDMYEAGTEVFRCTVHVTAT